MPKENPNLNDKFRHLEKAEYIVITLCRGEGTEEDPARYIQRFYKEINGELEFQFEIDQMSYGYIISDSASLLI